MNPSKRVIPTTNYLNMHVFTSPHHCNLPILGAAVDQDGAVTEAALLGPGHDDRQLHQVAVQSAGCRGLVRPRGGQPASSSHGAFGRKKRIFNARASSASHVHGRIVDEARTWLFAGLAPMASFFEPP